MLAAEPGETIGRRASGGRSRQPRGRAAGLAIILAVAALTAGCQPRPPAPAPVIARVPPKPPPPKPPPPPPPPHAGGIMRWSFATGPDRCVATASGDHSVVRVTVVRNGSVALSLGYPPPAVRQLKPGTRAGLSFSGPSGHWSVQGQANAQRGISASSPPDEVSLGRILLLLGGGSLDAAAAPKLKLPPLQVGPAGPEGQAWFDCARAQMI